MKELLRSTFFYHYLIVWAAGTLGLTAAIMACLGIYGVASHAAASRIREIGIRTALGARPAAVVRLIVRRSMTLTALGVPIGCALAFFAARHIVSFDFRYPITDSDPWTYATASIGILLVAFLASFAPARRAAKADPMQVLRHE
jgi:ABC-type antimicrobial peptide transport system permease subunit